MRIRITVVIGTGLMKTPQPGHQILNINFFKSAVRHCVIILKLNALLLNLEAELNRSSKRVVVFATTSINCEIRARLLSARTSLYFEHRTYSCHITKMCNPPLNLGYPKKICLSITANGIYSLSGWRLMSLLVLTHSGVSPRPHLPQESRIFHLLG